MSTIDEFSQLLSDTIKNDPTMEPREKIIGIALVGVVSQAINDLSRCATALERLADAAERSAESSEEIVRRSVAT